MAKALSHSPFLTGNQERGEGGWCALCGGGVGDGGPQRGRWDLERP